VNEGDNNKEQPMDENTFWLRIWQTVALVAAVGIVTVGGCTAYESKRVADAVAAGKDPIDARCGIAGTTNSGTAICSIRAAR
jgi:hypothetical protein